MTKIILSLLTILTFVIAGDENVCKSNLEICAKQDIQVAKAYLAKDYIKMKEQAKEARRLYRGSLGSCFNTKFEKTWEANSERLNELIDLKDLSDDEKVRELLRTRK